MDDKDLAYTSASEIRDLIAGKRLSPVEITELYFRRIEGLDSRLNSYLTLNHDEAMKTAQAAEEAVVRGDSLGPLHGVPISIKDLEMTKGLRTTRGSLVYKDSVPEADSAVVERVRRAGAIILGKTNTSEFGGLGANENLLGDDCRNPWNTERTSGASSGGAGSSLAAGLCPLATGSDGGGSIRIPASFCGVYGIKPTQGRVSQFDGTAAPVIDFLSQSGPMSRTVHDSTLLLQVLAGHDPRDPSSLRETPPDFLAAVDRDVKGLRIGWSPDYGYAAVDPEAVEVAYKAARVFEEMGCSVGEAALSLEEPFQDVWDIFGSTEVYSSLGHLMQDHADQLTWYIRESIEAGAKVTGADYARALGGRERMKAQFADVFEKYDLLLSPTMAGTAFPVREYPKEFGGHQVSTPAWDFLPFTHPINTIGHPAATVPCGFSSDGMPIGLHIVGRMGDEATVVAASAAFERARPWAQHRPPVS